MLRILSYSWRHDSILGTHSGCRTQPTLNQLCIPHLWISDGEDAAPTTDQNG